MLSRSSVGSQPEHREGSPRPVVNSLVLSKSLSFLFLSIPLVNKTEYLRPRYNNRRRYGGDGGGCCDDVCYCRDYDRNYERRFDDRGAEYERGYREERRHEERDCSRRLHTILLGYYPTLRPFLGKFFNAFMPWDQLRIIWTILSELTFS